MTIQSAIEHIGIGEAKALAKTYFEECSSFPSISTHTGAHFESLESDQNIPNQITASDLMAVQNLSVSIPARAAIGILEGHAEEISGLLEGICATTSLGDVSDEEEFDALLGVNSSAQRLWDLLRRNGKGNERWGIGATTASKIMARKRPQLIPIEDSVVNRVIQKGTHSSWHLWWKALSADSVLKEFAKEVREHVDRPDLSTLRTLDIVLWRWGKKNPNFPLTQR